MHAYFCEGEPIGETETLVRLTAAAGLAEPDEVRTVLAGDAYAEQVRAEELEARELGINGVPFFVLDRRYGVSGAQPAGVLLQALDQAWADAHPKPVLLPVGAGASQAEGEACTDESCAI
jgi:predicted DsbA family dithiol-disulfide isomerase